MEEKTGAIHVAVKGVLVEDGKALIVRRADHLRDDPVGRWEFPGGTLEFGERPEETLAREFHEETGLTVVQEKLLYVDSACMNPYYQIILIAFLCRRQEKEYVKLSDEHLAYQWADSAALRRFLAQDIQEALDRNGLWDLFT